MNSLFLLTSAINSRFGVYSPEERLQQTIDSIETIKKYAPGAQVALLEMTGVSPTPEQLDQIKPHVQLIFDYSKDEDVVGIYNSTDNWDIVKNTTEVMVFSKALNTLTSSGHIQKFDRVFKMSGRYQLTENFVYSDYDNYTDRIVVSQRRKSQFPPMVTGGLEEQYMSRLWSWPANVTDKIIEAYDTGFLAMAERLAQGGYFDIEHMLLKYLPADLVTEVAKVGIAGLLGPNGIRVED